MKLKNFLLYSIISFCLPIPPGFGKICTNIFNNPHKPEFRDDKLPNLIDKDTTYNKKNLTFTGTLNITEKGSLIFKDNSRLIIKDSTVNNNGKSPIEFHKSTLTGSKTTINSQVVLKDSVLTYVDGYIKHLDIQGTANIAVKGTKFDTLDFKNLGVTDPKIGVGFNNITVKNVNINIKDIKNDVKRNYNMKDANIEHLDIKGYINIEPPKDKPKPTSLDIPLINSYDNKKDELNTNFSFTGGHINKLTYLDPSVQTLVKLPRNTPGVFNFKDLVIEDLKVSYNLLRNLGFNGVVVNYFELKDVPNAKYQTYDKEKDPNKPKVPEYNNLQLIGGGVSYFEIFNLNNAKELKIEGEVSKTSYNAPLSSLCIKDLRNYENTEFSLYNIKEINFGIERTPVPPKPDKDKDKDKKYANLDNSFIPPMPQVGPPGGTKPVININYLHRVTTLGIYDNTVKFTWALEKNQHTNQNQYLSIYNLSNLNLINSLIDVTETNKLTKPVLPSGTTYDPRKEFNPYDLNFTYEGSMSAFGTIFNFYNSGAVKNGSQYNPNYGDVNTPPGRPKENYVPLRIKVRANSFTVANNMLSNLEMQLNGERNLFTLESNKYDRDFLFHTNYNFEYLDPKDGNQKPNPTKLKYNYWTISEDQRVEQNWYTFKCDMVVVDKGSKDYQAYKAKNGNKDYATTWFTYWQPYKVDKEGNPAKDGKPDKDTHKYGDNKAWEQGTDGSGRGGFPCEFGNKIQVENSKLTMLKPLDNLTVLEVVGFGEVNFHDMDEKYLKPQKNPTTGKETRPQWITILRMRGGSLRLAKLPLVVDKLQVYTYGSYDYTTFTPVFEDVAGKKATDIFDNQRLIVNKLADFNHNYLNVNLYFNDYFLGLNQKVTLNILEIGEYKEKVKDEKEKPKNDKDKDKDKEVIKKGEIKNLEGVRFAQGILFDTNYYWKDNKIYVEITRTKNFGYFINNIDKPISNILDKILEKYSLTVDKDGKFQYLKEQKDLNKDTIILINALFQAKSKQELEDRCASMRPINNETLFITTTMSTEKLLESVKNSNNYTYESNRGKLTFWANSSIGNSNISNKGNLLGADIHNQTLVAGTSSKINKFKIGAFVGYAHNKFSSAYNNGEAPQYGGGIYTDINFGKGYFIKMAGIATSIHFKGHREHYFMNASTNFKFNGVDAGGSINVGKTFYTRGGFLTTYVSANIGYLKLYSYKEDGKSSATINVKGFKLPYYFTNIGIEYAKQIDISVTDSSVIVPKIGIAYKYRCYNLADTECQFNKINNKDILKYTSNNYNNNGLIVNAGINFLINYHSSITSNFNAELINKDITSYNFYIGYKYSF